MNIIMVDASPLRYELLDMYIITACGVSALTVGTPDSNNVPGIHIEVNACIPLFCSGRFLFLGVKKMLL